MAIEVETCFGPKNCPRGWESHDIDCLGCYWFEQIEKINMVTGEATIICRLEKESEDE